MDATKEKIVKLLALALDQAGSPEGELASRRAMEMMERYGIDEIDLKPGEKNGHIEIKVPSREWGSVVAAAVAKLTGTFLLHHSKGQVSFVGRKIDIEIAEYLTRSLISQAEAAGRRYRRDNPDMSLSESYVFKESWGFGLWQKALAITKARKTDVSGSTALTPIGRAVAARDWAKKNLGPFGRKQGRNLRTSSARGYHEGNNANIQGGVRGKSAKRLGE